MVYLCPVGSRNGLPLYGRRGQPLRRRSRGAFDTPWRTGAAPQPFFGHSRNRAAKKLPEGAEMAVIALPSSPESGALWGSQMHDRLNLRSTAPVLDPTNPDKKSIEISVRPRKGSTA